MKRDGLSHQVRQRLERLPPPHDAHYGVVPAAPPEGTLTIRAAPSHMEAMRAIQRADRIAAQLPQHFPLSRVLIRQEAVNSSSIEDTHSTLDAVLKAEEIQDYRDVDASTSQVRDYAVALEAGLRSASRSGREVFTLELIKSLHRSVMASDPGYSGTLGELRTQVVWIGGRGIEHSTFNPPPPVRVANSLDEHIAYLRVDGMQVLQQSIILRLAIAHAHFEAIHPFQDGNGRVGRLLIPLMLAADGHAPLYLAPFMNANRDGYYAGLRDAQQQEDLAPLVEYFSEGIIRTVTEAERTVEAIAAVTEIWERRTAFRSGSAAQRALGVLGGYPAITATRLATLLSVTYAPANNGLAALCKAGIVDELTGYRRNRIFVARDLLRIFNRPYGDMPELPVE